MFYSVETAVDPTYQASVKEVVNKMLKQEKPLVVLEEELLSGGRVLL